MFINHEIMRILGIDPGLRICGYGLIKIEGAKFNLIEAGTIRANAKFPMEKRLTQIAEDMDSLLERLKPDAVSVEELYAHYAHPKTAILMGHARGVILQRAGAMNIEVYSYAATKIKKSLTGHGRASKLQMQRAIQSVLSLSEVPEPPDVADAIAIAMCHANAEVFSRL